MCPKGGEGAPSPRVSGLGLWGLRFTKFGQNTTTLKLAKVGQHIKTLQLAKVGHDQLLRVAQVAMEAADRL